MRARFINELQYFRRGTNPHVKLQLGKHRSSRDLVDWAIEQFNGYGLKAEFAGYQEAHDMYYINFAKNTPLSDCLVIYDKHKTWSYILRYQQKKTSFNSFNELLDALYELNDTRGAPVSGTFFRS